MSGWGEVGSWLKSNAGPGTALVGSLLTGNIPRAVAAGVALVSGATGHADPQQALAALQADPAALVRLKELALQDEASTREHVRAMAELEFTDAQAAHHEAGETIRAGDQAEDTFVKRTRPGQSWLSLIAAICYVFVNEFMGEDPDLMVLSALLTLPFTYMGLREVGKGLVSVYGRSKP